MDFTLSDFDYYLPDELIAQEPAEPRDHARLLIYNRATRQITDDHFYNILDYLPTDTTLVVNNSEVEKCRLLFKKKAKRYLSRALNQNTVRAMVRPGRKFKRGKHDTIN
ncbi:MAG: S-adenosylmethionine:tRNA ribosyltransferase-isomerase [Balneolaceae bacterium]|nr:S-adenosylmethionine:tRNA ribosyltransferase-isomerase [Balneolaceae bacterium]